MVDREELEERIIEYLEGTLSKEKAHELEKLISENSEYQDLLQEYKQFLAIEQGVKREEYSVSPALKHRVMDLIVNEKRSILQRITNFIRTYPQVVAGVAATVIITFTIWRPGFRGVKVPKKRPNDSVATVTPQNQDQSSSSTSTEIITGEPVDPSDIFQYEFSADEVAFGGSGSEPLGLNARLLNTNKLVFPVGDGSPIGVSSEVVRSPRINNEVIVRITLSGVSAPGEIQKVAEKLSVYIAFNKDSVLSFETFEKKVTKHVPTSERIKVARGDSLISNQQFTMVFAVQLREGVSTSLPLLDGKVKFIEVKTGNDKEVPILINLASNWSTIEQASRGFQELIRVLILER